MSKGLILLDALQSAFLLKNKDFVTDNCVVWNIKTGERYKPHQMISIIEKELKALDIIIEKRVQISWFSSLLKNFPNYTHHDYNFALPDNMQLMEEEYEILKEVLS